MFLGQSFDRRIIAEAQILVRGLLARIVLFQRYCVSEIPGFLWDVTALAVIVCETKR